MTTLSDKGGGLMDGLPVLFPAPARPQQEGPACRISQPVDQWNFFQQEIIPIYYLNRQERLWDI
jgi:hypothetical protein